MASDLARARTILSGLKLEIDRFTEADQRSTSSAFTSWASRTRSTLTTGLGPDHHITEGFASLSWTAHPMSASSDSDAFLEAAARAQGYIDAALHELDELLVSPSELGAGEVDDELWKFVESDVRAEHWGKATTQATLFTEDRVRKWTGQPAELVGKDLATAVFGDKGDFRLGRTAGEKQGWLMLAMGIAQALRNSAGHRIEDRLDHRRYALGVLGACSLLLTQLRYEHGNRFHDRSPAAALELPDDVAPAG